MCVGKAKAAAGGEGPSSAPQASSHGHATPGARVRLAPPATGEGWSGPAGLRGAQERGTAGGLAWDLWPGARFGAWTSSSACWLQTFLALPRAYLPPSSGAKTPSGDSGHPRGGEVWGRADPAWPGCPRVPAGRGGRRARALAGSLAGAPASPATGSPPPVARRLPAPRPPPPCPQEVREGSGEPGLTAAPPSRPSFAGAGLEPQGPFFGSGAGRGAPSG